MRLWKRDYGLRVKGIIPWCNREDKWAHFSVTHRISSGSLTTCLPADENARKTWMAIDFQNSYGI